MLDIEESVELRDLELSLKVRQLIIENASFHDLSEGGVVVLPQLVFSKTGHPPMKQHLNCFGDLLNEAEKRELDERVVVVNYYRRYFLSDKT
jgi:hypothetical protein